MAYIAGFGGAGGGGMATVESCGDFNETPARSPTADAKPQSPTSPVFEG